MISFEEAIKVLNSTQDNGEYEIIQTIVTEERINDCTVYYFIIRDTWEPDSNFGYAIKSVFSKKQHWIAEIKRVPITKKEYWECDINDTR